MEGVCRLLLADPLAVSGLFWYQRVSMGLLNPVFPRAFSVYVVCISLDCETATRDASSSLSCERRILPTEAFLHCTFSYSLHSGGNFHLEPVNAFLRRFVMWSKAELTLRNMT